jgi:hypothetical protein
MFTDSINKPATYALGEKIMEAIQDNDQRDIDDVVAALLNVLVTLLSLVPPSGRKRIAEEIGRCLPLMVKAAGLVAAGRPSTSKTQ